MILIWQRFHPWVLLYVMVALVGEFGQLFGLVPGTYDNHDVLAYLLGFILPTLLLKLCDRSICGPASHCL
jgi:hydrogenase/urease accessory protein HupE